MGTLSKLLVLMKPSLRYCFPKIKVMIDIAYSLIQQIPILNSGLSISLYLIPPVLFDCANHLPPIE